MLNRYININALLWMFLTVAPCSVFSVETQSVSDTSFSNFNDGSTTGIAVLNTGQLSAGLFLNPILDTTATLSWNLSTSKSEDIAYLSSGPDGNIFSVELEKGLTKKTVWDTGSSQPTCLMHHSQLGLLAGLSPDGMIYQYNKNESTATLWFNTNENYIWDIAERKDGSVLIATGPKGKILHASKDGNLINTFETGGTNVTKLILADDKNWYASTQGKAQAIRFDDTGTSFVLYSSEDDEIRTMALSSNGKLFLGVNSTSQDSSTAPTPDPKRTEAPIIQMMQAPRPTGKSTIVCINTNGFIQTYWQATEQPIYDMMEYGNSSLLVACGKKGQLYKVEPNGEFSRFAMVPEESITKLLKLNNGKFLIATSNKSKIYRMAEEESASRLFVSRLLQTSGQCVKWGNIELTLGNALDKDSSFKIFVRTGNTQNPDKGGWTDWKELKQLDKRTDQNLTFAGENPVSCFLQYKLEFPNKMKPVIRTVSIYFTQFNVAPVINAITFSQTGQRPSATAGPQASSPIGNPSMPDRSILERMGLSAIIGGKPSDMPSPPQTTPTGRDDSARSNTMKTKTNLDVSWSASDANGDKLRYGAYYKAEDEALWRLINDNLKETRISLPTDFLADGIYSFKIEAYDDISNSLDTALSATLVSNSVIIDNTAPDFSDLKVTKVSEQTWKVSGVISDSLSNIDILEYDFDDMNNPAKITPTDGIFDRTQESFVFTVTANTNRNLSEYILTIRGADAAGNQSLTRLILK